MRSVIQAARGVAIEAYESWLTPSADLLSLPIQREVLADRYHVVENLMDWVSKEISRNQIPGRTIMIIIFQTSQIKRGNSVQEEATAAWFRRRLRASAKLVRE